MKKYESGITMVALIITIVVLVIITGVTIRELDDDGVISESENEVEYQQEVIENQQRKIDTMTNEQLNDWGF